MQGSDISRRRLANQHLVRPRFKSPADIVRWLGAVQSQDYAAAKWALGLRLKNAVDDDVDRAFNEGSILRTHVLRPTWHFVAPEDIRWMIELTAPRVNALAAYNNRKLELDAKVFKRSNAVLAKALEGGKHLTRDELRGALDRAGIAVDDLLRVAHIIMRAEVDAVICSGPRRGKQFTYALLDERAPQARSLPREEALAELAKRFFTGHGPATPQDFAKWSGLTVADAMRGLEDVKGELGHEEIDGRSYWFSPSARSMKIASPMAHLLPNFDEYTVGYRYNDQVCDPSLTSRVIFDNAILVDGWVVGNWKRTLKRDGVAIKLHRFAPLQSAAQEAVAAAAERYGAFLGLPVAMEA